MNAIITDDELRQKWPHIHPQLIRGNTLPPDGWEKWTPEEYSDWCDIIGEWSWFHLSNHASKWWNE